MSVPCFFANLIARDRAEPQEVWNDGCYLEGCDGNAVRTILFLTTPPMSIHFGMIA